MNLNRQILFERMTQNSSVPNYYYYKLVCCDFVFKHRYLYFFMFIPDFGMDKHTWLDKTETCTYLYCITKLHSSSWMSAQCTLFVVRLSKLTLSFVVFQTLRTLSLFKHRQRAQLVEIDNGENHTGTTVAVDSLEKGGSNDPSVGSSLVNSREAGVV